MSHFDVYDNEMNTNAIEDTHAVYIQQYGDTILKSEFENDALDYEDDQTNNVEEVDDIFVNNELANDAVASEDAIENDDIFVNNNIVDFNYETDNIRQNKLTWLPLVYTTRLDEMNVFDKIEKYTPKEAAMLIQYESKPQYKKNLPLKREPPSCHTYSFMKLYNDIERLNQKVQTETKLRNEELMSICKPLKIVLKDIKATTDSGSKKFKQSNRKPLSTPNVKIQAKPKMAEKVVAKGVARFQRYMSKQINDNYRLNYDSDSSDDIPLTRLKPCVINSIQILPGKTTLAFIDKTSMKADIYILSNPKDLLCSYQTDANDFNSIKKTNPTKNTILYKICCWVKRDKQIKLLSESDVANESAISFMRIPHRCSPALCTCCCNLESPMPKQSSITCFKMSRKKTETNTEVSKLIQKAYSYRTKLQNSNVYAVDEPVSFLKNAVIMMKYQDIMFSQTSELGERYEIGKEGDIDNHMKLTVNLSMLEERELHEKHDRENNMSRQFIPVPICCWYKREKIIRKMSDNLSPKVSKYLHNPHLCKSHKCQCCCKGVKSCTDDKSIKVTPSKKHLKGIRRERKYYRGAIDKSRAAKFQKDSKTKSVTPKIAIPKIGAAKNIQNSIAVLENRYKSVTVQTTSQTVIKNPSGESQPNVTNTVSAELMTRIFDKFKAVKLSVNTNGKLTANINTPPENLLPIEIKVLADVLAQATNQMHGLGIEPEEFCRQVNLKSLFMNANPGMEILAKLPLTTQPSSLLSQKSASPPPLRPIDKKIIENTEDVIQLPERVKLKSQPCKAYQIAFKFPSINNCSKLANLYSMMSHTGCIRNTCMTSAYSIYFDLEIEEEPESKLKNKSFVTNLEEQTLPKIVNVQSLVDTKTNTEIESNRSKRKNNQADKSESEDERFKIRVLPPERISTLPTNPQMNISGSADLASLTKNVAKPKEPIPGHSQESSSECAKNRTVIPIMNENGELATPFNNIVLAQGINGAPSLPIPDANKMWAYVDGKLGFIVITPKQLADLKNQTNPTLNENYVTPKTDTVTHTPMITVSNGIPMQVSHVCPDIESKEETTTDNADTQENMNSLLRRMLTKESQVPNLLVPQTTKHRYSNARKRSISPLILAHSKEMQLKKLKVLDDSTVSNPGSKENLQDTVTESIEIIDSDDEEQESIFGV